MSVIAMLISSYAIRLAEVCTMECRMIVIITTAIVGTLMVLHRNLAEDIIMSQRNHLMTFF